VIPDDAVEAVARVLRARLSGALEELSDEVEWEQSAIAVLTPAAPHILRSAADYLEGRMSTNEPTSDAEQKYQAGYADAVARLLFLAEGKTL
jgi:hypothetical protein